MMVLLKMMIIWSIAQELAHQSDPTLGPETALQQDKSQYDGVGENEKDDFIVYCTRA